MDISKKLDVMERRLTKMFKNDALTVDTCIKICTLQLKLYEIYSKIGDSKGVDIDSINIRVVD